MEKLKFIMVFHNHQPVGNFDYVLEKAFNLAYKPFLDVFKEFNIKMTLHISGPLFFWLKENKPSYIDEIKSLVDASRIEILGSGYSEPILAAIPEDDAINQIKLFSRELKDTFGDDILGSWLTERVWEPHLPKIFQHADIKYIITDDYHFIRAGFTYDELDGYYLTEFENKKVAVYPGSEKLRYYIPFRTVEENRLFFEECYAKGIKALIFADDGEKFGIWPETYKWVYDQRWLYNFFDFLENSPIIETITLKEHFYHHSSKGICYLPTTSYPELGEWALPANTSFLFKKYYDRFKSMPEYDEIKHFFQGGHWKIFLSKYGESQIIHKRMIFISEQLRDKPIDDKKELFLSQCNDAYWHGVFGGLYLPHLRREINSNLIKATKKAFKKDVLINYDFDTDNKDEIFIKNDSLSIIIDADDGATVLTLDCFAKDLNLFDTLTRRKEAYHLRLMEAQQHSEGTKTIHDIFKVKEEGLHKILTYDKYYRSSLRIHLFKDLSFENFSEMRFVPHNIATCSYYYQTFQNELGLLLTNKKHGVTKHIYLKKDSILTDIACQIPKGYNIFGIEFNINLFAPHEDNRYFLLPDGSKRFLDFAGEIKDIKELRIKDEWYQIELIFKSELLTELYIYPVYTVSLSEDGVEKTYQGSCLLFYKHTNCDIIKTSIELTVKGL